jgi:hypothetical protein
MTRTLQTCTRCGQPLDPIRGDVFGLCGACFDDSRCCPRCEQWIPLADFRGSYCKPCRSEYYREWNQRGRR